MLVSLKPSALGGTLAAPPSKSLAHRAVVCAALAKGVSRIRQLAYSQDIAATLGAVEQLCAKVTRGDGQAEIEGLGGFRTLRRPVDCGESGSTLRFLIPLSSLSGQDVTFVGHGRLFDRPMGVYRDLFRAQNRYFEQTEGSITIAGALPGGPYGVPGNVSSQFVSGLLFALPLTDRDSEVYIVPPVESRSYIELTRSVLADYGIATEWKNSSTLLVPGKQSYQARDYTVEGDYSQAAFLAVLGSLVGGVTVTGLRPHSGQGDAVILDILQRAGAHFRRQGDAVAFEKSTLSGVTVDLSDCPDLGPILMVLGLFCQGVTTITHAERLRLKESDRIAAMEAELHKLGGRISSDGGTITIAHSALTAPAEPLSSHNDHRVAMSLAVAALAAGLPAQIEGAQAVQKSWPAYWQALASLGAEVTQDA